MTHVEADNLMKVVSETVLSTIRKMSAKQIVKRPICLDSISLALRIPLQDLAPVIDNLKSKGEIIIHTNPNNAIKHRGTRKPDSVSLLI